MSRTVLFAGGPLHGRAMVVDGLTVVVPEPLDISAVELSRPLDHLVFRQVVYNVSKLALLGRIIWIGHLGNGPDQALVFEVITSDRAKQASSVPDRLVNAPA